MDFHTMKRKELQELCKKHKIPANLTNLEMANRLASLLKIDNEKPKQQPVKSCLKSLDDLGVVDERTSEDKEAKKVRFSPQNQTFEFEKTNPRAMRLAARRRKSVVMVEDKIDNGEKVSALGNAATFQQKASENVSVDNQVKNTRTRGRGRKPEQAELSPKRKAEEIEESKKTSRKRTSGVVDLVAVRSDTAMKNTVSEARPVTRRSARNVERPDDSASMVEPVENGKMPKRKTRSDCPVTKNDVEKAVATRSSRSNTSKSAIEDAKEKGKEKARVTRNTRQLKRDQGMNETVSATADASVVEQYQQRRSTRMATKRERVAPGELSDKKSDEVDQVREVSLRNKQPRKQVNSRRHGKLSTVKHAEALQTDPVEKSVKSVDISEAGNLVNSVCEAADIQNMLYNDCSAVEDNQGKSQLLQETTSPTLLMEECEFPNAEEGSSATSTELNEHADEKQPENSVFFSNEDGILLELFSSDGETREGGYKEADIDKEEEHKEAEFLNGDSTEDAETELCGAISAVSRSSSKDSKKELENSAPKVDCRVQSDPPSTSTTIDKFIGRTLPVYEPGYQVECEPHIGEVSSIKGAELEDNRLCAEPILSNEQVQLAWTSGIVDSATAKESQSGDMLFIPREEDIIPGIYNLEDLFSRDGTADVKSDQSRLHNPADTSEMITMVSTEPVDSQADECIGHLGIHESGQSVGYFQAADGVTLAAMVDERIERAEGIDTYINNRFDDLAECERNHKQGLEEEDNSQKIHEETNGIVPKMDSVVISNELEGRNMTADVSDVQLNDYQENADLVDQNLEVHEEKGNIVGCVHEVEEVTPAAVLDERSERIDSSDDTADCEISQKQGLEEASNSQLSSDEEAYGIASLFQLEYAEEDNVVLDNEPKWRDLMKVSEVELNTNNEGAVLADPNLKINEEGDSCRKTHEVSGRLDDEAVLMEEAVLIGLHESSTIKVHSASSTPSNNKMELVGDFKKLEVLNCAGDKDNITPLKDDAFMTEAGSDPQNLTEMLGGSTQEKMLTLQEVAAKPISMHGSGHMDHIESNSRISTGDEFRKNVHLLFPCQNEHADTSATITQEESGKVACLLENNVTAASPTQDGVTSKSYPPLPEPADVALMNWEEYGSNAKKKDTEGKLAIPSSVEEAKIADENGRCDDSRTTVEQNASSTESQVPAQILYSAKHANSNEDFIGLVVLERIAEQTEQRSSSENLLITPGPEEADKENFSLPELEGRGGDSSESISFNSVVSDKDESVHQKDDVPTCDILEHCKASEEVNGKIDPLLEAKQDVLEGLMTEEKVLLGSVDEVCPTAETICKSAGPEPADESPMDWEEYGSNVKNKDSEEKLAILSSVEEAKVSDENERCDDCRVTVEQITSSTEAQSPAEVFYFAKHRNSEEDLIGLGVLERIAKQTEQQSNSENFSLTPESEEADKENSSLPEPEGAGADYSELTPFNSVVCDRDEPEQQKYVVPTGEILGHCRAFEEVKGKIDPLLEDENASICQAKQDVLEELMKADEVLVGSVDEVCPTAETTSKSARPEPADISPMDWEEYGSNAKKKDNEEKLAVPSSVEEAKIADENGRCDGSRTTVEQTASSTESEIPSEVIYSAKNTNSEEDFIGLVVLERIEEQTEQQSSNENFSPTPEPEEADKENFSLPEPEGAGGDFSEFTPFNSVVCDKDESVHQKDAVPSGDFLDHRKAFEEVNGKIGPLLEEKNASIVQAKQVVFEDLMKEEKVLQGSVDEVCPTTAATMEGGSDKMEAPITASLLEMRSVIPDEFKNADVKGISNEDIFQGPNDSDCGNLGVELHAALPTCHSEDTNPTKHTCAEEDVNVHETGANIVFEPARQETDNDAFGCEAVELNHKISDADLQTSGADVADMEDATTNNKQVVEEQIKQGCDYGEFTVLNLLVCSPNLQEEAAAAPSHPKQCKIFEEVGMNVENFTTFEEAISDICHEVVPRVDHEEICLPEVSKVSELITETFERLGDENVSVNQLMSDTFKDVKEDEVPESSVEEMRSTVGNPSVTMADDLCQYAKGISKEDEITSQLEMNPLNAEVEVGVKVENCTTFEEAISAICHEGVPKVEHEEICHPEDSKMSELITGTFEHLGDKNAYVNLLMSDTIKDLKEDEVPESSVEEMRSNGGNLSVTMTDHLCQSANVKGISKDDEITPQLEMNPPNAEVADGKHDKVESSSRKPATSVMIQKKRSILIHGTPRRPIKTASDMKENSTAHLKREHLADATAFRPLPRRKALEEIHRR